jgi:galactokinase
MTATDTVSVRGRAIAEFERRFGAPPQFVARAPGRVNLIGDHTDYNDGFVLPMAIDRSVWIAIRPRNDRRVVVYSLDFDERAGFDLDAEMSSALTGGERKGWIEYVHGVAWSLRDAGYPLGCGWDGVAAGDVPVGAGLSSSAALELATARAFAGLGGLAWEPIAMARLAQRAEKEWVGVNCGIMDQLISAAGRSGHALLIDCRSLQTRAVPIPPDVSVVVLDTATRRGQVESAYSERRAQCEAGAAFFGVAALRDVDRTVFSARAAELDPIVRKRARHVVTENERTLAVATALEGGDAEQVGRLMDESHSSLRDDFEVSRPELDTMVRLARAHDGCYGARMAGVGFGACAVALVATSSTQEFVRDVTRRYAAEVGLQPALYVCVASQGASLETT